MAAATASLIVNNYPNGINTDQRRAYVYGRAVLGTTSQTYVVGGLPLNFATLTDESGATVPYVASAHTSPLNVEFDDVNGSGYEYRYNSQVGPTFVVSAWAIASNVVTFTGVNSFVVGQTFKVQGLVKGAFLNGMTLTVLSAGLSGTAFAANFTAANVSSTSEVGIAVPTTKAPITAWSITSNVVSFTAANSYTAGQVVTVSGLVTGSYLNGGSFVVSGTGLSATGFQAAFTHANASATENGTAVPQPTIQIFTVEAAVVSTQYALTELTAVDIPTAVNEANIKFKAEFTKSV